jgi:hypothetical protein
MAKNTSTSSLFSPRAKGQTAGMKPMPTGLIERVEDRSWPFLPSGRGKTSGQRGRVFKGP